MAAVATPTEPRLIVALDYGTTYTGVAFASTSSLNHSNWIRQIQILSEWPGPNGQQDTQAKVPSSISYTPSPRGHPQFGYAIEIGEGRSGVMVIAHTKLELLPKSREGEMNELVRMFRELPVPQARRSPRGDYAKTAREVVQDFLQHIARELLESIERAGNESDSGIDPQLIRTLPMDLIITHPAIWDDTAKTDTFRAVRAAFSRNLFPLIRNISIVSEPEACAVYTIKSVESQGVSRLTEGEVLVVCDAGGGTVDLASFRIAELRPQLKLERVGYVTGGKCGAAFISEYFLTKWLSSKLSAREYELVVGVPYRDRELETGSLLGGRRIRRAEEQQLLDRFEVIKKKFSSEWPSPTLGVPLDLLGSTRGLVYDEGEHRGIRPNGSILILRSDLEAMFKDCVEKTLELVEKQIHHVSVSLGHRVNCIYLSGGFGESQYLLTHLRNLARPMGIPVELGDNPWTAVVRGAVLTAAGIGAEPPPAIGYAPNHYGVCLAEQFASYKHQGFEAYHDAFDDERKAGSCIKWLVAMNSPLPSSWPLVATQNLTRKFKIDGPRTFRLQLVKCSLKRAPSQFLEVIAAGGAACNLDYDLSDVNESHFERFGGPGRARYFQASLSLEILVDDTVRASVSCAGLKLGEVEMPL